MVRGRELQQDQAVGGGLSIRVPSPRRKVPNT